MAELMIRPLVSMVNEKASNELLDMYRVMEGMEEQRKILDRQLPAILGIIQHVEEKVNPQVGVGVWLRNLKSVSYEANDVFDEFKYEALRREAQKKGHHKIKGFLSFPARNPIVFRYRMGKKLRKIVQTIEVLVTEMNKFGFRHIQQAPPSKRWRETDPIMVDSDKDIISRSRDEEKKKIMRILLDEACGKDLTVLPIVGMGGLGKTTFVQLIYNDPAIEKHFELRRWCCVSNDFDAANIANNICQTNVNEYSGREKALWDLQRLISGKRYLIVLDDVWDPNDDNWGKLKTCLNHGDKGSVVLTTTRNAKIAQRMAMGVAEAYNIERLSDEHLKEILESRAFSLQKPNHCELDEIVDKIVDKCVGCPLAAKALGSVLSTKTDMNDWKDILTKTNIYTDTTETRRILKLSFEDLPSYMKQCFAFCAIFPKDYDIDVEILIQLWMAHDFIPLQEDNHPKTTGAEIFKELAWRSFFQDVKSTSPIRYGERLQLRNRTMCKIHDLMHDIALAVAGKECATIVDGLNMKKILSNPTRHLYLSGYEKTLLDDCLKEQSSTLRTLFYKGNDSFDISKCTSLRALHLPSDLSLPRQWMALPKQIHHLRSIGELRNLNDLGGELKLCSLENATEAHAKEANLECKEKLTHLSLAWDDKGQEELVQDCYEKILNALKPHDGLQMLRIVNYKGTSFPTWITYLSNLTELHLTGCILCKEFPPFCHFKDLQALRLEKLDQLQSLCGDAASMTFLALKELQLHDLKSLERWVATEGKEVMFPVLEKLDIKNCPKLTSLPEAPNLMNIKLDEGKAMLSLELVVKSSHFIPSLSMLNLAISDREEVHDRR
ncbi:hypothetical protein PR202_gb13722 [Eleusine coracana subsp. coracana]|uniref:Uncharacterized protein n=1 Tax=Eleusine coracana subsp. coracana TaxID=191504 RepID=A0AAV5ERA0_ELECO|nr:hypothetical protein PR202_gb13722 [Eleusine coracana subsp. coracana]